MEQNMIMMTCMTIYMTIIITIMTEAKIVKLSKTFRIWRKSPKEIQIVMFMIGLEILILKEAI